MNDCALITGAAHGIGASCGRLLAARGSRVVLADIDLDAATLVANAIESQGGDVMPLLLDVGRAASWELARAAVHERGWSVSTVVNNAFALDVKPAHEMTAESWDRQISVILDAVFHSVKTFHADLTRPGGAMVNVSSVHAVAAWPGHPAYAAAKGGVLALTRQLAVEYSPNLRVNAVIPGAIRTRVWDGVPEEVIDDQLTHIPAARLGTPDDVAEAVAFLASSAAAYITGTSLLVDGGLVTTV